MATTITRVCDCCQKSVDKLSELKEDYAMPHIKELCDECLQALEAYSEPRLKALQSDHAENVRIFLTDRRATVG